MLAVVGSWVWTAPRTAYADEPVLVRTWLVPAVMDQGDEGACVGFAWAGWAMSEPSPNRAWVDGHAIYHEAQTIDPWPGEDYEGTSTQAGAAVLARWGRLHSLTFTDQYEVARQWLLHRGPVILDTPWLMGMMDTRSNGYVTVRGQLMGYHAVECYDIRGGSVGCQNSWGAEWGRDGQFRISRPDFEMLLQLGAEVALATYPPPDVFAALRFS
jgi:hypothetical protein